MDIPPEIVSTVPHSSMQAMTHPLMPSPLFLGNGQNLVFPPERNFPPFDEHYFPQHFVPYVPENKAPPKPPIVPFLPAFDRQVLQPMHGQKSCAGCANHDECAMFKPTSSEGSLEETPVERNKGKTQERPAKRARLDNTDQQAKISSKAIPIWSGPSVNEIVVIKRESHRDQETERIKRPDSISTPPKCAGKHSTQICDDILKRENILEKELPRYKVVKVGGAGDRNDSFERTPRREEFGHHSSQVMSSPQSGLSLLTEPVSAKVDGKDNLFDINAIGKEKEMTVNDFFHKNPSNKRHEFNNAVVTELFPMKHFLFPSKRAFQLYLAEQQKWRWEFYQAYVDVATRVNNTLYKPSSGFAQNCSRFEKMPETPRGEDVRRCEATSKVLEDIASRIADLRIELLKRKGSVIYTETGEARFEPCPSELHFLEQIFDETDKLYQGVFTMMSNVNTTWEKLQELFSEEQVERAERQRVLRRRRENLRKKKKRALISLEKAAIKLLSRISPIGVGQAERPRVVEELNIVELNSLNTKRDSELLHFLLEKQCFDAHAGQVILGKIRMLEAMCGAIIPQPAAPLVTAVTSATT